MEISKLKSPPKRLALDDLSSPTSFGLTDKYYPGALEITKTVLKMFGKKIKSLNNFKKIHPHDVPGDWFKGPF